MNILVDKYGRADEIRSILQGCYYRCLYDIAKNVYINEYDNIILSLQSSMLPIFHYDKEILYMITGEYEDWSRYIYAQKENKTLTNNRGIISNILKQKTPILLQPPIQYFPYSKHYNPEYIVDESSLVHYCILIGFDEDKIIFHDSDIDTSKVKGYESKNELYSYDAEEYLDILDRGCNVYTVHLDKNEEASMYEKWTAHTKESCVRYFATDARDSLFGSQYCAYYGREGLRRLKNDIKNESVTEDDSSQIVKTSRMDQIVWHIDLIINARKLALYYIVRMGELDVIECIGRSINAWTKMKNRIMLNKMKGTPGLGTNTLNIADEIELSDHVMFEKLK